MPSSEYPLDVYKDYLLELENTISALQSDGPVMVTGYFNWLHGESLRYGRYKYSGLTTL